MSARFPNSIHILMLIGSALIMSGVTTTFGAGICSGCGAFGATMHSKVDAWTLEPRTFCDQCRSSKSVCAVCQLPLTDSNATAVGDGRYLCARDAQLVILEDREALRVLYSARRELDRVVARFTQLPSTNILLSFASHGQMDKARRSMAVARECPTLLGTTRSVRRRDRTWSHEITILRALPTPEMIAVYAHELGHSWIHENVPAKRKLSNFAVEGFCETLAYLLMQEMGETHQMKRIQLNTYTKGQLSLFVKTYQTYDLNPILEWTLHGLEPCLREDDPDLIRNIQSPPQTPAVPGHALRPFYASPPTPTSLVLTGILTGTASQKVALINGKVVSKGETTTIHLGTHTIAVRCLEITSEHVILALPDDDEQVTLKLP